MAVLALLVWFGPATPNVVWPGLFGIATDPNVHLDMLLYADYAHRIDWGQDPYSDFAVEYPPLALAMFMAPLAFGWEVLAYRDAFIAITGAMVAATVVLTMLAARGLGAGRWAQIGAGALVAFGPLLLGHDIAANRYDLLPVFLVALAAFLAVRGHLTWAAGFAGLGLAAKFWPAVMLVPLAALAHRRAGGNGVARAVGGFAAAAAIPFAIAAIWGSASGIADMVQVHADRPLQVEAVGASVLVVLDGFGLGGAYVPVGSFGSLNIEGGWADALPTLLSVIGLALLAAILWLGVRRVRDSADHPEAVRWAMTATLASVLSLVVLGKVGSPQFTLWALPLPFLIAPTRLHWPAGVLVALSLALTNVAFRNYLPYGFDYELGPAFLYLFRGLALVALLVIAVGALARGDVTAERRTGSPSPAAA